jgi:hypothetical protein
MTFAAPSQKRPALLSAWVLTDLIVEAVADKAAGVGLQVLKGFADELDRRREGRYPT